MEKLLFKRIEVWVVLLLAILGAVATLWYGGMLYRILEKGETFRGSRHVVALASMPTTLRELRKDIADPVRALVAKEPDRFAGEPGGFTFAYAPGTKPEAPYVLVNRYDGDLAGSVSELVDLNTQEVVHSWVFDTDPVWADLDFHSDLIDLRGSYNTRRFRNVHADLAPDGSIVTQGLPSPLLKYGLCGDLEWVESTDIYHHSIERDAEGAYWVPAHLEPKTVNIGGSDFHDDALVRISPEGEVLYQKSVAQILDENGLAHLVWGRGFAQYDPIHINDIQPVFEDGVLWRKGDLWVSLRHLSMIFLYRPDTNEILWARMGPWMHQHDVNVIDDRTISVFDNAARLVGEDDWEVREDNAVYIVDVTRDDDDPAQLRKYNPRGFEKLDVRTMTQGRARILGDGNIFVEETNYGRLLSFDAEGNLDWSYLNRAEQDGRVFLLTWSRIVDRDTGDAVRALVEGGACKS